MLVRYIVILPILAAGELMALPSAKKVTEHKFSTAAVYCRTSISFDGSRIPIIDIR